MKTTCLSLLLFLAVQALFGQKLPTLEDPGFNRYFFDSTHVPTIKGRIINLSPAEISKTMVSYDILIPYSDNSQQHGSAPLNADGSFEIKLAYPIPFQQVWVYVENLFFAGIYVNSEVFIELDAQQLRTEVHFIGPGVRYLGRDGQLNEYTNNHVLYQRERQLEIDQSLQLIRQDRNAHVEVFARSLDSLFQLLREIDEAFILENPSEYGPLLVNERQSEYLTYLIDFHWGKTMSPERFKMVAAHQPMAMSNDGGAYYRSLFTFIEVATLQKRRADKLPFEKAAVALQTIGVFDSLFTPYKSDILKMHYSSKEIADHQLTIELVLPHVKTAWCKQVLSDHLNDTRKKIAEVNQILDESKSITSEKLPGKPIGELAFGARLFQVEQMSVDSFLTMLKSSFPNKALFIDFWATWCGPCIAEFPHSKKLSSESKDLPVEFVYLCTSSGSDLEKWKTKVVEHQIAGTHIFVGSKTTSDLMNLFSANGFPSYVFINAKGEYKPGAIRRPSQMSRAMLEALVR